MDDDFNDIESPGDATDDDFELAGEFIEDEILPMLAEFETDQELPEGLMLHEVISQAICTLMQEHGLDAKHIVKFTTVCATAMAESMAESHTIH